jgi:hypothetical protein
MIATADIESRQKVVFKRKADEQSRARKTSDTDTRPDDAGSLSVTGCEAADGARTRLT